MLWVGYRDPFELQGVVFEIQEKSNLQAGKTEVGQKLGGVGLVESVRYFCFKDDLVFNDQVGDRVAYRPIFVKDGMTCLLGEIQVKEGKFDAKGVLVDFLIQAWPQGTVDFHRGTDDLLGQF